MNLVSSIFFRVTVLGIIVSAIPAMGNACFPQESSSNNSAESAGKEPQTTPTYRTALGTFGGPSVIRYVARERTDLGVWTVAETIEDVGIVLDWSEEKITLLRPALDEPVNLATRNVVHIKHTFRYDVANELQAKFHEGRFQEVLSLAAQVVGSKADGIKLARWEQKLILAMLVESCKRIERWDSACTLFISLAKESPPDLLANCIPIPWFDSVAEIRDRDKIRAKASSWLKDPNEMVMLLGACWSLDGELRDEAIAVLKNLARDSKHPLIRPFATAQLWRTVPPAEFIKRQLNSSRELRDSLFLPAQSGLSLLIAERCNRAGESELALQEWVRVVTMHSEQRDLAYHAMKSAVNLLRSTDREEMASQIEKLAGKNLK